ncbi:MAG: SDR family NAD(P)-dependent oxidoreductase [Thermoguttaceae bacterium]
MSRRTLKKSRVLLTGASSGIGRALALELAREGADLVLLARRQEKLEQLRAEIVARFGESESAPHVHLICGDVTDSSVRNLAIETARLQLGGLDVLINNAGVGATALIEETSDELAQRLMEVNYFSALSLTNTAIPLLQESANDSNRVHLGIRPLIVFLGSIVGLRGVPHFGAYGAAKFAVSGLSETLRAELYSEKIDVLLVSPGTTKTEFFDSLLDTSSSPDFPTHHMVSPESVAQKMVLAMKSGKHRIIPYFPAQILYFLNRLCPFAVDKMMTWYKAKRS